MDTSSLINTGSLTWCRGRLLETIRTKLHTAIDTIVQNTNNNKRTSGNVFSPPRISHIDGCGELLPGEVVLVAGPSGCGKSHLWRNQVVGEDLTSALHSACSRFGTVTQLTDLSQLTTRTSSSGNVSGPRRRSVFVVVCHPRRVSLEDAMKRTFNDDTTLVHHALLPPLTSAIQTQPTTPSSSSSLPSGILAAFEILLPMMDVTDTVSDTCTEEEAPHLIVSLPTWDHFELAFGSYSNLVAASHGGGDSSEGRPQSLSLVQPPREAGDDADSDSDEDGIKKKGQPSEAHPTFACSPELLAHFVTTSQKVKGTTPAYYLREPGVIQPTSSPSLPSVVINSNGGDANTNITHPRRMYQMSLVVCECTMGSPYNLLDPLLLDGPTFGLKLFLPTPTQDERVAILKSSSPPKMSDGKASSFEDLLVALAARTGGHSCEYVGALGQYLWAALQHSSVPPSVTKGDEDTTTHNSAFSERILKEFEGVWLSVVDEALDLLSAGHPSRSLVGGNSRAALGHVDVQRTLWSDIAGHDEAKEKLKMLLIRPLKHKAIYKQHGLAPSLGAVLYGPPGTGKTMLAKAMATEASASFIYLDLADLISCEIGESERVLSEFFAVGKSRAPCILFMDELQAAFGQRYDVARGGNNAAHDARLVSALLALLDSARKTFLEAPVVFVGATNMLDVIDSAILRPGRLDVHVFVGPPDEDARRTVIESYIHRRWASWIGEIQHDHFSTKTTTTGEGSGEGVVVSNEAQMKQDVVNLFLSHSSGLTGAEIKNALNQFALDVVIGSSASSSGGGGAQVAVAEAPMGLAEKVRKCCESSRGSG